MNPKHQPIRKTCQAQSGIKPRQEWINGKGREQSRKPSAGSSGKEVNACDEGLHALRCLCIGVLETSNIQKDLGGGDENVCRHLPHDVSAGWWSTVYRLLQASCIEHAQRPEHETPEHTFQRPGMDTKQLQNWIPVPRNQSATQTQDFEFLTTDTPSQEPKRLPVMRPFAV